MICTMFREENGMRRFSFLIVLVQLSFMPVTYAAGEFGAYYTKIDSGEEFEAYSRTGAHADIVVTFAKLPGRLVFWRGAGYLPYWETTKGRWPLPYIFLRKGDGPPRRPDRVNTYARARIIVSTQEKVVVHWRYLPRFEGTNPHLSAGNVRYWGDKTARDPQSSGPRHLVTPTRFVDDYFTITNDGTIKRVIVQGTDKYYDWLNKDWKRVQTIQLLPGGIEHGPAIKVKWFGRQQPVPGVSVKRAAAGRPVACWKFDEGCGHITSESVAGAECRIEGPGSYWKRGVSGSALAFDGYETAVSLPSAKAQKISDALTLEAWVALGAYPWNWCPVVHRGDDDGYFLGVGGHGHVGFRLMVGDAPIALATDKQLSLRKWYHIAGVFDKEKQTASVYINGEKCAEIQVPAAAIKAPDLPLVIGKGKPRRPTDPVRSNTFVDSYGFDGLIDEVRIYDRVLKPEQIKASYAAFHPGGKDIDRPDLDPRSLPAVASTGEFGAHYRRLDFYDTWDGMWRFGDDPDVVVTFDRQPGGFVFWRGTCFIPMLVNEKGQWYSNEFNETWGTSGGRGCQEPMSDKEGYTNYAKIIENTPARVVVQWRYPLIDVLRVVANFDEKTGWGDWSDWFFYIYPDGVAVKRMRLWTHGNINHEWQESMAILGPGQHPEEVINTEPALLLADLDGNTDAYNWTDGPPRGVNYRDKKIHIVNYKAAYSPFTIGDFRGGNVYGGEVTKYSVFPSWNHWPVAQMPSDGRYASFPDRAAHSSLTHVRLPVYREDRSGSAPWQERLLMEGMTDKDPEALVPLARSWLHPAELTGEKGCRTSGYERSQRAYLLSARAPLFSFTLAASKAQPVVNPCFVIRNWGGDADADVALDGKKRPLGPAHRQGIIRDVDGSKTMIIYLELEKEKPVSVTISGASPDLSSLAPLTWEIEPKLEPDTLSVVMKAALPPERTGIEYCFEECSELPHGIETGTWQSSPQFTATGLMPETTYRFRVKARDRFFNESPWSKVCSVRVGKMPGPAAHWAFDDAKGMQAEDGSGDHTGMLKGDVEWSEGRSAGGVTFKGGGWIAVADPVDLSTQKAFTWTAWIRTKQGGTILARTGPGEKWQRGGKVLFVADGRLAFDIGWVGEVRARGRVDDGKWHHVAVTGNEGALSLFIDGTLKGEGTRAMDRFPEKGLPVKVGFCNDDFPGGQSGFDGAIDDVRWYNFSMSPGMVAKCAKAVE